MNFVEIKKSIGYPICKHFPKTPEDWEHILRDRIHRLEEIFRLSVFPTIGEFDFLWPNPSHRYGTLNDFLPGLKIRGELSLAQQGIFRAESFWPKLEERSAIDATSWIWGYGKPRGWILAKVTWDTKSDCHTGTSHQCPKDVEIKKSSFKGILEVGFQPQSIWDYLGQGILTWSQKQEERANRGRLLEKEIVNQEIVLSALRNAFR